MARLRKTIAAVAAATLIGAGFPPAPVLARAPVASPRTTPTAPGDPTAMIQSTINSFPSAGAPLKLAISDLIVAHPTLAAAVASYVRDEPSLTPEQREAVVAGLSDALNRLGIVAQEGNGFNGFKDVNPLLIIAILGGIGAGVWALTSNHSSGSVSPN
jgi:hypothetical protein